MQQKKGGKLKWIIIAVVILGVIGAAMGGSDNNDVKDVTSNNQATKETETKETKDEEEPQTEETESEEEEPESEEKTEFYVGETAEQKDIQITLVNVTESTGSEFIQPDEGNVFVICEFDITNNSEEDINISSVMNFEAYCDDYSLNQDIMGLSVPEVEGKNQLDGSVAAGKKMNGIIAYQVPSTYSTLEINVAPDFWASNDIKFVYKK